MRRPTRRTRNARGNGRTGTKHLGMDAVAGAMANGVRGRPRGTTVVAFVFIVAAYFIGGLTSGKFPDRYGVGTQMIARVFP